MSRAPSRPSYRFSMLETLVTKNGQHNRPWLAASRNGGARQARQTNLGLSVSPGLVGLAARGAGDADDEAIAAPLELLRQSRQRCQPHPPLLQLRSRPSFRQLHPITIPVMCRSRHARLQQGVCMNCTGHMMCIKMLSALLRMGIGIFICTASSVLPLHFPIHAQCLRADVIFDRHSISYVAQLALDHAGTSSPRQRAAALGAG